MAAQVAGAFLVLCLLSSATYLVNDVRDREQDRLHPRKRSRPVAAGELSPRARSAGRGSAGARGHRCSRPRSHPALGAVACGYLALTASYSLWLRRVVVLDILAIAAGFVLRAIAGRRRDRHLPVALVCHRDGVLRHLSGRREAVCRAARARRLRARAGDPAALLAPAVCA